MKKGLWVSPSEFRSFAAVDRTTSLSAEIATRQRAIDFYSLGMYLPNPDPVLKKMGKDISVYKELRADAIVRGCIAARKARTKKLIWEIDRGKSKSRQAKFIERVFENLPVRQIIGKILDAPLFGYQPLEVMWDKSWTPVDLVAKPQKWFVFDENNRPRFLTKTNMMQGEELPEKKFIFATNDADYENPYGDPALSSCFWPVTFRKGGYKFWITFTEKYGMPWPIGKQPRGTNETETNAFADMLEKMIQDGLAVIPDDSSVDFASWDKRASAEIYDLLIRACTGEINVALLGHSAGAQSTPGKLGGEDTAGDTGENIGFDDQHIVEDAFNTLIDWTCEYNFAERSERPRFLMYEEEDVDLDQATRDKTLADAGVTLTPAYYQRAYGFADGDIASVGPKPQPQGGPNPPQPLPGTGGATAAQFSAPSADASQAEIDNALESLDPAELQKQMEGVLKPVIDLINSGTSYEEIMKQLVKAYPDMDTNSIEEMLSRAIFASDMWGRLTAERRGQSA